MLFFVVVDYWKHVAVKCRKCKANRNFLFASFDFFFFFVFNYFHLCSAQVKKIFQKRILCDSDRCSIRHGIKIERRRRQQQQQEKNSLATPANCAWPMCQQRMSNKQLYHLKSVLCLSNTKRLLAVESRWNVVIVICEFDVYKKQKRQIWRERKKQQRQKELQLNCACIHDVDIQNLAEHYTSLSWIYASSRSIDCACQYMRE